MSWKHMGILDKPDSEELWTEIIDRIPDEVFLKPDVKILNVACGYGTEANVIIKRMRKLGFNDEYINNCIYVLDRTIWATNRIRILGGFKNVIRADFLTWETDMKFDIVVGNPPYQDSSNLAKNNKLWHKFVKKVPSVSSSFVAMVTPSSIFNDTVGIGEWLKKQCNNQFNLISYELHEKKQWFTVGVDTCHWIIDVSGKSDSVRFPSFHNPLESSIFNKLLSSSQYLPLTLENPNITKSDTNKGSTEIYYSGKNKTTVNNNVYNGGLKIVYPFSASYSSQFITDMPTCRFNKVLYIPDVETGNRIMSYTNSKLYNFYASRYKKTAGFTPVVKNSNLMPRLDSDQTWNDQSLYDHFNLTSEEVELIEKS